MTKTAMQELIEQMGELVEAANEQALNLRIGDLEASAINSEAMSMAYRICKNAALDFLPKEKEQIEQAYGDGLNAHRTDFCNRDEYYNKNFTTN